VTNPGTATKTASINPPASPITIILNVTNTSDSDSRPKQHVKLDEDNPTIVSADPINVDAHMPPPPKPHRRKEDKDTNKSFTASVPQFSIVPVEPAASATERVNEQPRNGAALG
jgi:hypothetical protein